MYEKIMSGKVLKVSEKDGLTVELTKGKDNNILSVWGMYKNAEGEWAYKGTQSGATAIRIPMSNEVVDYLIQQLQAAKLVNEKNPFVSKSSEVTTKKFEDLTLEELEKLLAKKKAEATKPATPKKPATAPKAEKKVELDLGDLDDLDSALAQKLLATLTKKKSK